MLKNHAGDYANEVMKTSSKDCRSRMKVRWENPTALTPKC